MAAGREELAAEAAEAIAAMENERAAAGAARPSFAEEIARLRGTLVDSSRRLTELDRGRRIARAAEAARRLETDPRVPHGIATATLAEAEDTLRRLRERQADGAAIDRVARSLDPRAARETLLGRLEAAGCGPHTRLTATDVLARIGNRTKSITPPRSDAAARVQPSSKERPS